MKYDIVHALQVFVQIHSVILISSNIIFVVSFIYITYNSMKWKNTVQLTHYKHKIHFSTEYSIQSYRTTLFENVKVTGSDILR